MDCKDHKDSNNARSRNGLGILNSFFVIHRRPVKFFSTAEDGETFKQNIITAAAGRVHNLQVEAWKTVLLI